MKNRSRDDIAYNVIDLDSEPSTKSIEAIKGEENIINVRQING
jgi:D-3-phosphoglycerate dehydrogenase